VYADFDNIVMRMVRALRGEIVAMALAKLQVLRYEALSFGK